MPSRLLRTLAWCLPAAVAFVTLSPIGLRPISGFSPSYERMFAFAAVGFAFALAYPRHIWLTLVLVLGAAVSLELLQLLAAGRHGRVIDMVAKLLGGTLGVSAGAAIHWLRRASQNRS